MYVYLSRSRHELLELLNLSNRGAALEAMAALHYILLMSCSLSILALLNHAQSIKENSHVFILAAADFGSAIASSEQHA